MKNLLKIGIVLISTLMLFSCTKTNDEDLTPTNVEMDQYTKDSLEVVMFEPSREDLETKIIISPKNKYQFENGNIIVDSTIVEADIKL
jgi:hypothetical protein